MMFDREDSEPDDFFEAEPQAAKPKEPKQPEYKPDDPRYYEREDEWEHIRPAARNWKLWVIIALVGVGFGLLYALFIRYFSPYERDAVQYGYVNQIVERGDIFKTFEGVLLPYRSLADTIEPYSGDIIFTAKDDHIAAELKRAQLGNIPVRIQYSTYHAPLPWRGESRILVNRVDTADVTKIFPAPDRHELIPSGGLGE